MNTYCPLEVFSNYYECAKSRATGNDLYLRAILSALFKARADVSRSRSGHDIFLVNAVHTNVGIDHINIFFTMAAIFSFYYRIEGKLLSVAYPFRQLFFIV